MKIKIVMSRGEDVYVTEEQAKNILSSQEQLIAIADKNGQWTGNTVNKAHIVSTAPYWDGLSDVPALQAPAVENPSVSGDLLRKMRKDLGKALGWDKK